MAIKNKDGSPFRLKAPNPLIASQSTWEEEKIHLYNFDFDEFVSKKFKRIKESPPQPKPTTVEVVPIPEPEPLPEPEPIPLPEPIKITVYYLPANLERYYDPLYDEAKSKILYGKQVTIEVFPIQDSDLSFQFWTTYPVSEGGIVYIPKERRWWKVTETTSKNDGLVANCVPSDINPSFQ